MVFIVLHDSDMRVRKAYLTDSGWAACWNNDHWCILMEEGEVVGSSEVKAWFPHSGWPDPKNFK